MQANFHTFTLTDSEWRAAYDGPLFRDFRIDYELLTFADTDESASSEIQDSDFSFDLNAAEKMLDDAERALFGTRDANEEDGACELEDPESQNAQAEIIAFAPDREGLSEWQQEAARFFSSPPDDLEKELTAAIVAYLLPQWDTICAMGGIHLPIPTTESVKSMLTLNAICLHRERRSGIGFSFNCLWDEEHGYGLTYLNDKTIRHGDADTAATPNWEH